MSYSSEVLADTPCLYWKLDETSGTTADNAATTGSVNDGTYSGDYTLGVDTWTGMQCVTFNQGAEDGQVYKVVSSGSWPTTALTLECWYRGTTAQAGGSGIMGYAAPSQANEFLMWYQASSTNSFKLFINNAEADFTLSSSPAQGSQGWKHVVMTWENVAGTCKVYVNGNLQQTITSVKVGYSIEAPATFGTFAIAQDQDTAGGGGINTSDSFIATMAHVAVYPTALSAARILAHYEAMVEVEADRFSDWGPDLTTVDLVPPAVSNWSATPMLQAGNVTFDATEAPLTNLTTEIWASFATHTELVFDGTTAESNYTVGSSDAGDVRSYTVSRDNGWPLGFTLEVRARDADNTVDASKAFTLSNAGTPTITNWTASPIASTADISVRVSTTVTEGLVNTITALIDGVTETVYLGGFVAPYTGSSLTPVSAATSTYTFLIHRTGGWPDDPTITVTATNVAGTATDSEAYTLTTTNGYPPHMNPFTLE